MMPIPVNEKYLALINMTENFKWFVQKIKFKTLYNVVFYSQLNTQAKMYVSLKIVIMSLPYITSQCIYYIYFKSRNFTSK